MYVPFFVGLGAGALAAFIHHLFYPIATIAVPSFFIKLSLVFGFETLLPVSLCVIPLAFLSVSRPREKILQFFPAVCGCFSVFLPYIIAISYAVPDLWSVVFVPAMNLALVLFFDYINESKIARFNRNPDILDGVVVYGLFLAYALVIAVTKVLWFFVFPWWIVYPVSLAIIFLPFYLRRVSK